MSSSVRSISFSHLPDFCAIFVPSIWSSNKPFPPNTTFRLFCHKILRTTQISTACVLLGLLYIHRLRSAYPTIQTSVGSEVRLFTTALILANKFLDDNTFTNKTWSDVSGIPVAELNIMEIEFLSALDYTIYVHHTQFFAWVAQCQSYRRTSAATAILTTTKTVKRSAAAATATATATAAMTGPYQRLPSKRQRPQKHHVPHTPPDETSHRQPPTIVKLGSPHFFPSASVIQPVLSWSSSSSAVASSRHTTFAASVCSTSTSAAAAAAAVPLVPFTPAATMIPSSLLTSRIRCLEIE